MSAPSKPPQQLMAEHQGLVRSLAKRIHRGLPAHVELDDLVAYGQMGLAEAAQSFNAQLGSQFSTYAYYRIRGAIYDGLSKMNWFSRAAYKNAARNQQLAGEVLSVEGEDGSSGDETLKEDIHWLKRTGGALGVVYLMTHSPSSDEAGEGASELADPDAPPPETILARQEVASRLHELLDELPPEAATLMRGVYFEGLTLQDAGQKIGVSKAWACRLHARTLERLARSLRRLGVSDAE
jgi:RNA polymerase sigma factor FliA